MDSYPETKETKEGLSQPPQYEPQPAMSIPQEQSRVVVTSRQGRWKADLFDCFAVPGLCIKTCFLPCLTYAETKEKMNSNMDFRTNCLCYCAAVYTGFDCCLATVTRGEIRGQQGINGDIVEDACTHLWCGCCALIQEHRQFDDEPSE
ncbi:5997_t:CDS:2 [Paraglomus occultum]|uniref:5997_t:CDS:1 n=1 Tax=Paraglomus occultum TaxID=144539 RepID=A0A9N9FYH4_9GLOM|nr:5997_t:CDS:2 [Paraglomus occultum]